MHKFAQAAPILEFDNARDLGKQRIISANSHIQARFKLGAPLSDDNGAAIYRLSGKSLDPESLGLAVSSVSGASNSFFVCHTNPLNLHLFFQCGLQNAAGDVRAYDGIASWPYI